MEVIEEIANLTRDDTLVLAVVRNILETYRVRLAHTMVPVRLVGAQESMTRNKNHRGQRLQAWA
jgi:hypothetical protein